MSDTSHSVAANGIDFAYLADGPEDGPLALCLHGFPDSAYTWRHLMPELAARGFRVVAPFMRGYAPSGLAPDGAYQAGALAADANALHEALGGGGDAVLIGHDWGAAATYGAAAHEPDRWGGGVVAMAVPPINALLAGFFQYEQLRRSFYIFVFQTPFAEMALTEDFVASLWRDWSPGHDGAADVAHVMAALDTPERRRAAIAYYRAMLDASVHLPAYAAQQRALTEVGKRPVLYLHGGADGCMAASVMSDPLPHLAPGSRVEIVEGGGHFLHLDHPAEVNRLILEWIG